MTPLLLLLACLSAPPTEAPPVEDDDYLGLDLRLDQPTPVPGLDLTVTVRSLERSRIAGGGHRAQGKIALAWADGETLEREGALPLTFVSRGRRFTLDGMPPLASLAVEPAAP